jgi:hypothetical protein
MCASGGVDDPGQSPEGDFFTQLKSVHSRREFDGYNVGEFDSHSLQETKGTNEDFHQLAKGIHSKQPCLCEQGVELDYIGRFS